MSNRIGLALKGRGARKRKQKSGRVSSKVMGPEERFYIACLLTKDMEPIRFSQLLSIIHSFIHSFLSYSTLAMEYLLWFKK